MAVQLVIESGVLSTEYVINVLARLNAIPTLESVQNNLYLREMPVANTKRYDSLRSMSDADAHEGTDTLVEVNHAS